MINPDKSTVGSCAALICRWRLYNTCLGRGWKQWLVDGRWNCWIKSGCRSVVHRKKVWEERKFPLDFKNWNSLKHEGSWTTLTCFLNLSVITAHTTFVTKHEWTPVTTAKPFTTDLFLKLKEIICEPQNSQVVEWKTFPRILQRRNFLTERKYMK